MQKSLIGSGPLGDRGGGALSNTVIVGVACARLHEARADARNDFSMKVALAARFAI